MIAIILFITSLRLFSKLSRPQYLSMKYCSMLYVGKQ
nr:MAG TPA: hypothetical protein [Caudoviricetes sp.]